MRVLSNCLTHRLKLRHDQPFEVCFGIPLKIGKRVNVFYFDPTTPFNLLLTGAMHVRPIGRRYHDHAAVQVGLQIGQGLVASGFGESLPRVLCVQPHLQAKGLAELVSPKWNCQEACSLAGGPAFSLTGQFEVARVTAGALKLHDSPSQILKAIMVARLNATRANPSPDRRARGGARGK